MPDIRDQVRERYAQAAQETTGEASCCGDGCCGPHGEAAKFGASLYDASELAGIPVEAQLVSLGCGNPLAVAELREGERVLDLGSGGGIDVLLSARRVGATGFAPGGALTDEMPSLAPRQGGRAGATNAAFHKGTISGPPLAGASVDVR